MSVRVQAENLLLQTVLESCLGIAAGNIVRLVAHMLNSYHDQANISKCKILAGYVMSECFRLSKQKKNHLQKEVEPWFSSVKKGFDCLDGQY